MEEHANEEDGSQDGSGDGGECAVDGEAATSAPVDRPRCQCRACVRPRCLPSLVVAIHALILLTAILCLAPMGVATSALRAYLGGIVTFVWLLYCCIMVASNVAAFTRGRLGKRHDDAAASVDEVDGNVETSRMSAACHEMGCLCGAKSKSLCFGVPSSWIVSLLLVIEGVLLLTPVFASASTYTSLNGGQIPDASSLAVDPRPTAFSFGRYMLPGAFSFYGGYSNNNGRAETLTYKEGCKPECELDIHTPSTGVTPSSGYPVM